MNKNHFLYHFLGILVFLLYIFLAIGSTATGSNTTSSHATASDVFNAGTSAATPFLQAETNRLKQQNDQFLNQVSMNLNVESNNYIRSLKYRTDYRNFINDWYTLRDRLYIQARQQNTSKYVKDNLPYIFMDNDMKVLDIVGDIAHLQWQEDGRPGQSTSTPYRQLPNY